MNEADLLARIAGTLRADVGPAVTDEFAKTQAFMAAVVLQKLAAQLAHTQAHAQATAVDMAALIDDLEVERAVSALPPASESAIETLRKQRDRAALSDLIKVLYADRAHLGHDRFAQLLTRVRRTLRADIDRQLVYAE